MKQNYKKGVSKKLLNACAGSDLDQHRLVPKDDGSYCEAYVYGTDGNYKEAGEWLKSNKKNLNA